MTPTQQNLLRFIGDYQKANNGVTPSYDDMRKHLGLKAISNIARYVNILEQTGHLKKDGIRQIVLTGKCPTCGRCS